MQPPHRIGAAIGDLIPSGGPAPARLFLEPHAQPAQLKDDALVILNIVWSESGAALVRRMDYLTAIFPYNLLEIAETSPGSAEAGQWQVRLHYWGAVGDKARLTRNLTNLLRSTGSEQPYP